MHFMGNNSLSNNWFINYLLHFYIFKDLLDLKIIIKKKKHMKQSREILNML